VDLTDHTSSDERKLIKWGLPHEPFTELGESYRFRRHPHKVYKFDYTKVYQIVEPSLKSRINKGDVIRIEDSLRVSSLIRGCKAVVRERYRIVKYKPFGVYRDYYAVVEILEGRHKGEIRKVLPAILEKIEEVII